MATDKNVIALLLSSFGAGAHAKAMFGEYGVYYDGTLVALVCDDRLFVKATPGGTLLLQEELGEVEYAPPYPGAKPQPLVPEERWDDARWMRRLVQTTAHELATTTKTKTRTTPKSRETKPAPKSADALPLRAATAKPKSAGSKPAKRTSAKSTTNVVTPRKASKAARDPKA